MLRVRPAPGRIMTVSNVPNMFLKRCIVSHFVLGTALDQTKAAFRRKPANTFGLKLAIRRCANVTLPFHTGSCRSPVRPGGKYQSYFCPSGETVGNSLVPAAECKYSVVLRIGATTLAQVVTWPFSCSLFVVERAAFVPASTGQNDSAL